MRTRRNKWRIKRFVDYRKYYLFVSHLAHEYKRLGTRGFVEKYKNNPYHGLQYRYLQGLLEYFGCKPKKARRYYSVVVDYYTYFMFVKYNERESLNESLRKAIPEFWKYGLLVTEIHRAVGDEQELSRGIGKVNPVPTQEEVIATLRKLASTDKFKNVKLGIYGPYADGNYEDYSDVYVTYKVVNEIGLENGLEEILEMGEEIERVFKRKYRKHTSFSDYDVLEKKYLEINEMLIGMGDSPASYESFIADFKRTIWIEPDERAEDGKNN